MHRQHRKGVNSLAGYIGEAMDGPPIHHAFIMAGKSFDIPAILFFLASKDNKNKQGDNLGGVLQCILFLYYIKMYHTSMILCGSNKSRLLQD